MKSSQFASFFSVLTLRNPLIWPGAFSIVLVTTSQAQVGSVGAVERVVEKRAGAGGWAATKKGTSLNTGDALRTGKRSKADALFNDGSLVRLGQLSSLVIESGNAEATRVKLEDGRVIFVKKRNSGGTSRVLTGTGAAEIKGSVVYVRATKEGAEYINYSGNITVVGLNAAGAETRRVVLPEGRSVKTFVGGELSPITSAAPFGSQTEMIDAPVDSPFPGSKQQIISRNLPGIAAIDTALPSNNPETQINTRVNPFIPRAPLPDGQPPFGGPFPPPNNTPIPTPTTPGTAGLQFARRLITGRGDSTTTVSSGNRSMAARINAPILIAQAPAPPIDAGQAAGNTAVTLTDDFRPTYKHLEEVDWKLGKVNGVDYRATAFVGNNSLRAGIGQIHGFVREGTFWADLAVNPQDIRFDTPTRRIRRNNLVVSHATLSYQAKSASLIAGRQRFLTGPIRASYFGSMTRVGGREIMDAVRFIPRLNKNYGAEISYLYDAYPRELSAGARGNQQGFLGRVYTLQRYGNFGLNFLRYSDSPVPDRTGITLDFSIPVITKKLEFYGEVGTDPFKRKLRTFGFTSPLLFERTGFDLYIERAKLSTTASAAGIGEEWAVRLYKPVSSHIDFVGAYNRFSGGNSSLLIGLSVGGQAVFPER